MRVPWDEFGDIDPPGAAEGALDGGGHAHRSPATVLAYGVLRRIAVRQKFFHDNAELVLYGQPMVINLVTWDAPTSSGLHLTEFDVSGVGPFHGSRVGPPWTVGAHVADWLASNRAPQLRTLVRVPGWP